MLGDHQADFPRLFDGLVSRGDDFDPVASVKVMRFLIEHIGQVTQGIGNIGHWRIDRHRARQAGEGGHARRCQRSHCFAAQRVEQRAG